MNLSVKLTALFLVLSTVAFADYHWTLQGPFFLSKSAFNLETMIPPPPAHGSAAEKADFSELKKFQDTRTQKDCERAAYEVQVSLEHLFGPKYGPLTEAEVQKLAPFFDKLRNDSDYFTQALKKKWARPRPYMTDSSVSPCVTREVTAAYPSGHAAITRVFADALSQWDPGRKTAFHARANRIA